ncbi:hypothetical protein G7Z17_g4972 [Cylindrodendrum hubeiense]|uniref:Uncharacterized protein n=1 Tax=Cylindrodendrum hubeiense TaxID=595255 RepID=A0A9P5H7W1_9HYPO|nr:hypothetical protein G7Z17_g4972 [Cylindrodendrum hubeiense]
MAQTQQTNHTPQPGQQKPQATDSSQAIAAGTSSMASSQWSEWVLHPSKLHYFRGQYLPYEVAATVVKTTRNSIVADGQGRYIYYEFVGINEVPNHHDSHQTPEPLVSPPPTNIVALPQQLLQVPELDDDGASGCSGVSGVDSGDQQPIIDIDTTTDGVVMVSVTDMADDHSIVLDKKTRKRLAAEKKRRVNTKAKVDTWLRH